MNRKKLLRPRHEPEYDEPVWLGFSRSSWSSWIILAAVVAVFFLLGAGAFLGKFESGFLLVMMIIGLAIILAVAALADVKVLIDSSGIHARCGAFGRPRRTIPWSEITAVSVKDVNPAKLGGFGFRWYPIKNGKAIVMRPGSGIEIQERNGSRFIITLEKAKDAAAFSQQFLK